MHPGHSLTASGLEDAAYRRGTTVSKALWAFRAAGRRPEQRNPCTDRQPDLAEAKRDKCRRVPGTRGAGYTADNQSKAIYMPVPYVSMVRQMLTNVVDIKNQETIKQASATRVLHCTTCG